MATSLILAAGTPGAKTAQCHEASAIFLENYRRTILRLARMPVLDVARYQVHRLRDVPSMATIFAIAERSTPAHNLEASPSPVPAPATPKQSKALSKAKSKPPSKQSVDPANPPLLPENSARIFKSTPPALNPVTGSTAQSVLDSLTTYTDSLLPERRRFFSRYRAIDVAFKVVGPGSVGLRDYCVYMEGNGPKDPFFLQIKEETVSAYAPYLGNPPGIPAHQGQRVIEGERAMQLQSDPFLGWTTISGRNYIVRQLNDHKASVDITQLRGAGLLEYAAVCGELLARGHCRAGDPAMLSGYIGASPRFDEAVSKFAIAYAEQTDTDWKHFVRETKPATKPVSEPDSRSTPKPNPNRSPIPDPDQNLNPDKPSF